MVFLYWEKKQKPVGLKCAYNNSLWAIVEADNNSWEMFLWILHWKVFVIELRFQRGEFVIMLGH